MGAPLQVIRWDSTIGKFIFDEQGYAEMLMSEESIRTDIRDLPVAIVSVVGDARKGKSFILNYFLRYLERHDQNDWLGDPDEPLTGFSWRSGVEKDTEGIIIWTKPFVMTRSDGSKIAVVLMDNQGFFDDHTDHEKVSHFFTISTVISSIQIFNLFRDILSSDVNVLSRFSSHANEVSRQSGQKPFQKLMFLLRDWPNRYQYEFGNDGGLEFLRHKMKNQREKFNQEWANLLACFTDVDCFLMPSLGDEAENPNFNGELRKLKPQFVDSLRELVPSLLSPDKIVTKSIGGEEISFFQIFNLLKELSDKLTLNHSLKIDELESINNASRIKDAFRKARLCFLEYIVEAKDKNESPINVYESAEKAALQLFVAQTKSIKDQEDFKNSKILELISIFAYCRDHFGKEPSLLASMLDGAKATLFNINWKGVIKTGFAASIGIAFAVAKFR